MQQVSLDFGDSQMEVSMPDSTHVFRFGKEHNSLPSIDSREATRRALQNPLGSPPLSELGGKGKKVVIGFPDRVKGGSHAEAHRKVAIPMIIEELQKAGTELDDITLLCCIGLHRKNNLDDWNNYLGKDIVDLFYPDRLVNHDAEADDLCDFGEDAEGNLVQCTRIMAEADVPIVIGHCAGNPYGGFSGGYKMIVTGMAGWRSIASHHCPKTMHRKDWLGASTQSHMRHQFKSIGQAMEKSMGKKFFAVDAVIGQFAEVLDVQAGEIEAVEKATWLLAEKWTNVTLDMEGPADVLVMGLPRNFHYGPGMGSNPILMSLAIGGQLSRCWNAFREGGVIIASAICDGDWNEQWFPSYQKTFEAMLEYPSIPDFLDSEDMLKISTDEEYRRRYSHEYAYHPFHAMSMLSGGSVPKKWCSRVILVGAQIREHAEQLCYTALDNFEDALRLAEELTGNNPRILCTPNCFTGGAAVHLHTKS